jgi:membrane associated rhomboid family serine protease
MDDTAKPSLIKRLLALVVLALAAWILLKFVIGVIAGVATLIVIVGCLVAVVWALRVL